MSITSGEHNLFHAADPSVQYNACFITLHPKIIYVFTLNILVVVLLQHSPAGERVRSRVELAAVLGNVMDVAMFDFKTGAFHTGQPQHPRRKRVLSHCTPQKSTPKGPLF